ncbi:thiol:disulfide interchange protein DsbA [mine drainage metagenome]|uniref:Thiol:disulfide interchange protein DsbA n=1 Tax=mine drainage metagenome TaxID=410659 RepID=T1CAG4_9ZZZZ
MRVVRNSGGLAVSVALLACLVGGLGARAAAANLPVSSRWKAGTNYKVLDPAQPTNAPPGKVQVMEFFYLACPFCHALEPHIVAWRKTKPAYVHFVQVPVMWAPLQVSDGAAVLHASGAATGRLDPDRVPHHPPARAGDGR